VKGTQAALHGQFNELYGAYEKRVHEIVRRSGVEDREAVEAETWLTVYRHLPEMNAKESERAATGGHNWEAWISQVARSRVADAHREETRRRKVISPLSLDEMVEMEHHDSESLEETRVWQDAGLAGYETGEEGEVGGAWEHEHLRRALAGLCDRERAAILGWLAEEKQEDTAARLGLTARTVYTLRERGLAELRRVLGARDGNTECRVETGAGCVLTPA